MSELDLKWALSQYKPSRKREAYAKAYAYYDGDHPMMFATEKFRSTFFNVFSKYAENVCAPVVDSLDDRLKVVGFRASTATMTSESVASPLEGVPERKRVQIADPDGQAAWDIWQRERLDLRSSEVHNESLLTGDAYVIVWPNEDLKAEIWPQMACEFAVQYDPNYKGRLLRACKVWFDDQESQWRLNIYLPDVILKYSTRRAQVQTTYIPVDQHLSWDEIDQVPNPFGFVPAFHFPNQKQYKPGISELQNVFTIQDALNKSSVDMLVAMEFASYKQRYIIGLDAEVDEETGEPVDATHKNYGVDRVMAIANEDAKVGQFDATDLTQFLKVQEKYWMTAARVTGTPLHYFYITSGDFPSGEAIKSAEGRFIKRIMDRQTAFGNTWEDVMKFAMQIDGVLPTGTEEEFTISAMWEPATPRSESELADTAIKKKGIGVPRTQLLREMGYSDEEIERFIEESDAEAMAAAVLQQKTAPQNQEGQGKPGESRDTTRARQGVPK